MIFVDTNYFLRFILRDITKQRETARKLFEEASAGKVKITTSTIVIFEIYWVLSSFYGSKKTFIVNTLEKILDLGFLELTERDVIEKALNVYKREKLSLEDSYNIAYSKIHQITDFATFDKKLENYLKKSN